MNAGLCIYDLPPAERERAIDRAAQEMRKSLQLTRITRYLNSLPAAVDASPCAEAVAGNFHMDPR